MASAGKCKPNGRQVLQDFFVLSVAIAVAVMSARPYAGSWNDGSRLASVECLVDYHTFVIDESIFVRVPPADDSGQALPYPRDDPGLLFLGTGDKLSIAGHYYSDKSPVPALLLAGVYQAYNGCTGRTARHNADSFCYCLTLASSGLAYVIAVWCIYRLAGWLCLAPSLQLAVTASFGVATVTPAYSRHVNNHIILLALFAALLLGLVRLANQAAAGPMPRLRLAYLGTLMGLAYTVDLGAGPIILFCALVLVAYRVRRAGPMLTLVLGAVPWIALHHAINYAIAGTWKPANAVPQYFDWPGCTFNAQNMTGGWQHRSIADFLLYSADLLVGRRGFLGHNLPVFLTFAAVPVLVRRRVAEFSEILLAIGCCAGTWLLYAATSNNYSGQCCSIRWFVPLLAPAYFLLILLLREQRRFLAAFLILSVSGAVEGALMWLQGPWMKHMVPCFWHWQGAALLTILAFEYWRKRSLRGKSSLPQDGLTAEAA